jgi:ATP-dependent DNA helicase RecQ
MFIASFDRPNLFLSASSRTDERQQLLSFLQGRKGQAGIIYCPTRQAVDDTAAFLQSRGWEALPYHAGLMDDVRRANQRRFINGDGVIVVATIAFGMGIDKPDVRFVLHTGLPKDLESYYQQIGRAGRDGLPADCMLLYSSADIMTNSFFISQQAADQRPGAHQRLKQMTSFAETTVCRRVPLLSYFAETPQSDRCDQCDNCREREEGDLIDVTVPAQKFLSCVKRTGERFGASYVINVLRGSQAKEVLNRKHDQLSTYGIGRDISARDWRVLADQFVAQGLLTRDPEYGTLRLTPAGYEVLKGKSVSVYAPRKEKVIRVWESEAIDYDAALFEILRAKRRELADQAALPPYSIFPDRSLMEMAAYYPQSLEELGSMYGIGRYKLDNFGATFVALIRDYCLPRGIASRGKQRPHRDAENAVTTRTTMYARLYEQGQAIGSIAADNGVTRRTVVTHLWRYARAGNQLQAEGLRNLLTLPPADERRARAALDELGADYLGPVYRALGEQVPYDQLDLLRALMACEAANQPPAS